jgi:hypothetical protein
MAFNLWFSVLVGIGGGCAHLVYALARLSDAPGEFWGWVGIALGTMLGGAGADAACLRSLLSAGLVEAANGAAAAQELQTQSRFVLTEAGCRLAWQVAAAPVGPRLAGQTCRRPPAPGEKPRWDRAARELWFAGAVVLRFRRGARNQERLLEAFQEQGWPPEIDDPLPRHRRVKPADRLRDTVKHLNSHPGREPLHFRVDAEGRAVFWSACGG